MAGGGFKPIDTGKTPGGAERKSTPLNYDYSKYNNQPIYQQPGQGFNAAQYRQQFRQSQQDSAPVATPASTPYSRYGGSPFTPGGMSYFSSLREPSAPLQFDYASYANQPIYQGGISSLPSYNLPMGGDYLTMMYNSPVSNQGYLRILNNAAPAAVAVDDAVAAPAIVPDIITKTDTPVELADLTYHIDQTMKRGFSDPNGLLKKVLRSDKGLASLASPVTFF